MSQAVFDLATQLVAPGAALTATGSSTPIAINARMLEPISWVLYLPSAPDFTTGDETYVFTLECATTVGGTYSVVNTRAWLGSHGAGKIHIPTSGELMSFMNTNPLFMRVTATLAGTSPSLIYGSYLTKAASRLGLAARVGDVTVWP